MSDFWSYVYLSNSPFGMLGVVGVLVVLGLWIWLRNGFKNDLYDFSIWTFTYLARGIALVVLGVVMLAAIRVPIAHGVIYSFDLYFIGGGLLLLLIGIWALYVAYRQLKNKRPDQSLMSGPFE